MLVGILAVEEEHANDMHDLLSPTRAIRCCKNEALGLPPWNCMRHPSPRLLLAIAVSLELSPQGGGRASSHSLSVHHDRRLQDCRRAKRHSESCRLPNAKVIIVGIRKTGLPVILNTARRRRSPQSASARPPKGGRPLVQGREPARRHEQDRAFIGILSGGSDRARVYIEAGRLERTIRLSTP